MKIISSSVSQTKRIGKRLASYCSSGDIICLWGELGAGKTVFVKGLAAGLGIDEEKVISPTFVLLREHRSKFLPLYHFDFYRLKGESDIVSTGFEEYFYGSGVAVVEWADRLKGLLPEEYLKIEIKVKGINKRLLEFSAFGRRYASLIRKLTK